MPKHAGRHLGLYYVGMHYNPRWRPACFASFLRPILLISKSWKGTEYQQTWSTTTPNDKIIPAIIFFKAFDSQKLDIFRHLKKKNSADFFRRLFLPIAITGASVSLQSSDPIVGPTYRVNMKVHGIKTQPKFDFWVCRSKVKGHSSLKMQKHLIIYMWKCG